MYTKWGERLDTDIRHIDKWDDIHTVKNLKQYLFLIRSGTIFIDIEKFFEELSPVLLKTGIGHLVYDKNKNSVNLNDQALLIESIMLPKTFGSSTAIEFPNFTKSSKNIHHDYTPSYLSRTEGQTTIDESEFGQDIIAVHLNKNGYFNNFPREVRQYKVLIDNPEVDDPFSDYKDMIINTLWIFNNEKLKIKDTEKVLCTGGGIGWMLQKAKTVHVCDVSKIQIKFVQECIDKWDGNNFGEFVHKFIIKNTVKHFHINLLEKQDSNKELLKQRNTFIDAVNQNLQFLLDKYRPGTSVFDIKQELNEKNMIIENKNILECVKIYHLNEINLSNIFDFKYNFVTDHIDDWKNLLSPATKSFIKSCTQPKQNPYNQPACEPLELHVPVDHILDEIVSVQKFLVPHRPESGLGWSSFCIHGKSYDATKEDSFYQDQRPHKWTDEALQNMPKTIAWLKSLGYKTFQRVRVMCLAPRGFINVHRDQTESKLGPVNVAITHPESCKFYLEHHGELLFNPGKAYRMNLVNYHSVINYSNQHRYHIIIHGEK